MFVSERQSLSALCGGGAATPRNNRLLSQSLQWLPERKFNDVPIRIAHRGEVSDHATDISWRFNQNTAGSCEFCDSIDLCARIALKSEMIQQRFHFVLHNYQHENRIFAGRSLRPEPDVVPPFQPSIANDGQTAERRVEIDGSINIAGVDGYVGPTRRHVFWARRRRAYR